MDKIMNLLKYAVVAALSLCVITTPDLVQAHEIKIGNLVISHPWSRQSPMKADVAAGYLSVQNTGAEDDRLLKATAEITAKVQLHDMKIENDVMKMAELPSGIAIPAGQTIELKPKSLHVMFLDLKSQVIEGEQIKGTLVFEKAGTVAVEFEVMAPMGDVPKSH
jgi:periplasmic copper chaperone A